MPNLKIDMHVHSFYSVDSLIKPRQIIQQAKLKQLNGIAIIDHNTLKGYKKVKKLANAEELIVIPGMEIETNLGEIIGLFMNQKIDLSDKNIYSIIDQIRDQNGLIIIPHPFDFLRSNHLRMDSLNKKFVDKNIDGIEVLNARIIFNSIIRKAKVFKEKYSLFETGGSDAHYYKEIGNAYTVIRDINNFSKENIRNKLLLNQSLSAGKRSNPLVHFITIMNKLKNGQYF